MKKYSLTLIVILLIRLAALAQDPRFSQYYASPLMLNPAETGFFNGSTRLAINERQQWWNVGANYNTTNLSADFKLFTDEIPEDDTFAMGLNSLFDHTLNGALNSSYLSLSAAYHKSLAFEGRHSVALGVQFNFANRTVDYTKLSFASQFVTDHFDTSIPVSFNESFTNSRYFDFNAGLIYSVKIGESLIYNGVSAYHLNQPNQSILTVNADKLPLRTTLHGGGDIWLGPTTSLLFSYSLAQQGGFKDQLAGIAYGLKTSDELDEKNETKLYAGLWYRINDSYIPYLGMDYHEFRVGLNYSLPVNPIYAYNPHTFEFSLTYVIKNVDNNYKKCPRF